MTDQSDNSTIDVATTPAPAVEQATNQSGTITKQDLDAFRNEIKQQMAQLYQGMQSKTDKFSAKMQQKMEALENSARAAGVQLTDAERQQYQSQAKLEILSQQASPEQSFVFQPGQPIPQGLTEAELIEGVNLAEQKLYVDNQVDIKRGDPEDALLAEAENERDPVKYLAKVQQAIDAKKARLGISTQAQPVAQPATSKSPGLVKGSPQSNPIANVTDPEELWNMSFGKR